MAVCRKAVAASWTASLSASSPCLPPYRHTGLPPRHSQRAQPHWKHTRHPDWRATGAPQSGQGVWDAGGDSRAGSWIGSDMGGLGQAGLGYPEYIPKPVRGKMTVAYFILLSVIALRCSDCAIADRPSPEDI